MPTQLTVSQNGRFFLRGQTPFFWLGDTAWLLLHRLTIRETAVYLENRARKGFTVILATLVHEEHTQNASGSPALIGDSFAAPNEDGNYWDQAEETVRLAASLGLVMALLPAWGHFYKNGALNTDTIGPYTDFLARRLGGYPNVVWLLGGDVRGNEAYDNVQMMGRAMREKCPGQLIGYHPFGRCSSSMWFHDCDWLDFNMFQSGHRDYTQIKLNAWDDKVDADRWVGEDNYQYVRNDLALRPPKPTLDGEPSYELIPHGLHDSSKPYWQACDVRRYAYWAMLSGAAGHTYGDNAIMQFWSDKEPPAYGAIHPWQEALHNPGSMQMGHMRRLMELLPWHEGRPCQGLLADNDGKQYAYNLAFAAPDAACVYTYTGEPFAIDGSVLPYAQGYAYWFDPVIGGASYIGQVALSGKAGFAPPKRRCGQEDWLLLIAREKLNATCMLDVYPYPLDEN